MTAVEKGSPQKAEVALIACPDYEPGRVLQAVRRGVDLLGGIGLFVGAGEKILLKPNLLVAAGPEKAVTTHPSVFRAVTLLCQQARARVSYGDSPAWGSPAAVAAKSGLADVARETGLELADFVTPATVSFGQAVLAKQLILARGVLQADGVISLPKMKSHAFMRITGAVKNQFGCVPGLRKSEFHVKMPTTQHFAAMLSDINRYVKPRLYIMDGVVAMEGNSPRSGTPRRMNVLLMSSDPVALDAVFCRLVDLPPRFVPTMEPAVASGMGTFSDREIDLLGDPPAAFYCPDFDIVRQPPLGFDPSFPYYLKRWISPRPVIDRRLCQSCGICTEICPVEPKAVSPKAGRGGQPVHDYGRCIRCYCCQELCPHGAIRIRRPILSRLIHRYT
jgi:uncharacterized protein (DUF362 family)/NAD-dependent dihydropyrimidine dehydrogenase PreA subunit